MNNRYDILVNKKCLLTSGHVPTDLANVQIPFLAEERDAKRKLRRRAAIAVKSLFQQAVYDGIHLCGISGYRSYERQKEIYETSIQNAGLAHTRQYIAPPGGSEHQTGLALDVSCAAVEYDLTEEFAHTKEGLWLKEHAPLYGFIIRYEKGKEHITGYAYEPWHIRFVTKPLALCLSKSDSTLEEYYHFYFNKTCY